MPNIDVFCITIIIIAILYWIDCCKLRMRTLFYVSVCVLVRESVWWSYFPLIETTLLLKIGQFSWRKLRLHDVKYWSALLMCEDTHTWSTNFIQLKFIILSRIVCSILVSGACNNKMPAMLRTYYVLSIYCPALYFDHLLLVIISMKQQL